MVMELVHVESLMGTCQNSLKKDQEKDVHGFFLPAWKFQRV